ncbi:hypothetical protein ACQZ4X_04700 [Agrobacterium vitis]
MDIVALWSSLGSRLKKSIAGAPVDNSSHAYLERFRREEAARLGRKLDQNTYRATDPAKNYVRCNCGSEDCWTNKLLSVRAHVAALFRAIISVGVAGRFADFSRHDEPWPGVIFALQLAGGLENLSSDPAYSQDDDAAYYCESAAEREDEDRELASKYTAALIMFNFAWTAYEAAIEISATNQFFKDKLPVRARRILEAEASEAAQISALEISFGVARRLCSRVPQLKSELDLIGTKYVLSKPAAAAELARIFRNHIVHGRETLPVESVQPCYRFYAVTRVILLLIQHLVLRRVTAPADPVDLSANLEYLGQEPANLLFRNLHYEDVRWRTSIPEGDGFQSVTRFFGAC